MIATEQMVRIDDGARLWTATSGPASGSPIVLCHGGPGLWDDLEPVAAMLDDTHLTHRYDQRGCGRSTGPEEYTLDRAIADLEGLRAHWGYERWAVFGHSWGATLALAYAGRHPDRVRALIHCSGRGPGNEWRAPFRAEEERRLTTAQRDRRTELEGRERTWAEEIDYRMLCWLPGYADPARADAWARAAASVPYPINWRANRALAASMPEADSLASKASMPTLLVHGERDPRPVANVRRLLSIIPNARLAVLRGAGHSPWLETPEALAVELRSFAEAYA